MAAAIPFLIIAVVVAFRLGMRFQKARQIDYKKRWREALDTIDAMGDENEAAKALTERDKLVVQVRQLEQRVAKAESQEAGRLSPEQLAQLDPTERIKIEKNRLYYGQGPGDPLTHLPGWAVEKIITERLYYGYEA